VFEDVHFYRCHLTTRIFFSTAAVTASIFFSTLPFFQSLFRRPFCHSQFFAMDDWFSDPFFKPERMTPTDVQKQFEDVHRHMSNMFQSMLNTFQEFDRHFLPGPQSQSLPALEDHSGTRSTTQPRRSTTRPIVQEPGQSRSPQKTEEKAGQPYFYASTMSAFSGPDGIGQARRKTYDSASGKTEMAEMRKLGDQALAMRREIGADGSVKDEVDRKNLDESEVPSFRQRWDSKRSELPKLGSSGFPALMSGNGAGTRGSTTVSNTSSPARRALR
jgi:hypothetical protein